MLPAVRFTPLALLVAASLRAHADEPVTLELNDVVVTASGFAQSVEDAPASVTVIDGEALRRKSYRDLGDAVRDVEGVTVNGGANETDISIRGMPADYTLIMVDGKRQSARESRVNGNRYVANGSRILRWSSTTNTRGAAGAGANGIAALGRLNGRGRILLRVIIINAVFVALRRVSVL
ncbi:hypothetical protein ALQ18_00163 [Pseudomonas marginalis pv. marginalis]|nr:hypothetical protein ALQ18_00163 [Pseudomonas marginalis pv. marginalis]